MAMKMFDQKQQTTYVTWTCELDTSSEEGKKVGNRINRLLSSFNRKLNALNEQSPSGYQSFDTQLFKDALDDFFPDKEEKVDDLDAALYRIKYPY